MGIGGGDSEMISEVQITLDHFLNLRSLCGESGRCVVRCIEHDHGFFCFCFADRNGSGLGVSVGRKSESECESGESWKIEFHHGFRISGLVPVGNRKERKWGGCLPGDNNLSNRGEWEWERCE